MTKEILEIGTLYKTQEALFFFGNKNSTENKLKEFFPELNFRFVNQTHGDDVVLSMPQKISADAHYTQEVHMALVIKTADCMPILILNHRTKTIAAVHAGWRGVANCIVKKTMELVFNDSNEFRDSMVLIGPHIQKSSFLVDEPVMRSIIKTVDGIDSNTKLVEQSGDKYLVDLQSIVSNQLQSVGFPLSQIHTLNFDTKTDLNFHSFRRDKENAGRQLSWICLVD